MKRLLNLERATLPQTLHLGLLRPRRVFGGVPVRLAKWLGETATLAATAPAVVVAVSELLLLRVGDGAAMQGLEKKKKEEERRGNLEGKGEKEDENWENWWRIFENLLKGGRFLGYLLVFCFEFGGNRSGNRRRRETVKRSGEHSVPPSLNGFRGISYFYFMKIKYNPSIRPNPLLLGFPYWAFSIGSTFWFWASSVGPPSSVFLLLFFRINF